MAKDFYQFLKKKDGKVSNKQIVKRFPDLTKESFLLGMGKWLEYKGMEHPEKRRAIAAMDVWWMQEVEKNRNRRQWFWK